MACDMFSSMQAKALLHRKVIYFFGDSNIRALYKDLLWLLENGTLIPESRLRSKNEASHANDVRLSQGVLHSGRNYQEVRVYCENPYITFHFITRLFMPSFIDDIKNLDTTPDVIVLNSCLWDLTRWGTNGVSEFKANLVKTFDLLTRELPKTRIIWLTTLPPNFQARGGFLTKEIEFVRNMLPWHILFANKYASDVAKSFKIDVLDLHYNFRLLLNYHAKDGIHWNATAVRHSVNMLLTHLALVWNCRLPGEFELDRSFLERSQTFISDVNDNSQNNNSKPNKYYNDYGNNNYNSENALNESDNWATDILYNNFEGPINSFVLQSSFGDLCNNLYSNTVNNFKDACRDNENFSNLVPTLSANQCTVNNNQENKNHRNDNRIVKKKRQNRTKLINVFRNNYFY